MIRHQLTLELIARELHKQIAGSVLTQAWMQEKNACTLEFQTTDKSRVFVRINVDHEYGTITASHNETRARKNSIDVFNILIGSTVRYIVCQATDRIVTFVFDAYVLHCCMFSAGAGNVVVCNGDSVIDALHKKKDTIGTEFRIADQPLQLGPLLSTIGDTAENIISTVLSATTFYILENNSRIVFSAVQLPGYNVIEEGTDLFTILRRAVALKKSINSEQKAISSATKLVRSELQRLRRSLAEVVRAEEQGETAEHLRYIANALMSLPMANVAGRREVMLTLENGTTHLQALDPTLTIIQNAEKFFNKARKAPLAAQNRLRRKMDLEKRIHELEQQIAQPVVHRKENTMKQDKGSPQFRTFVLNEGYTVFVGRNSANNDMLTMKFAKQNDYWFHVRGQSGSHCVLRSSVGNVKPPKHIIEQTAAIAAYYSSARNAGWVPVVFTLRKYVRKPKGAAVGAVTLEREEVIMVKPGIPSGLNNDPDV